MSNYLGIYVGPDLVVASKAAAGGSEIVARTRISAHDSLIDAMRWLCIQALNDLGDNIAAVAFSVPDLASYEERGEIFGGFVDELDSTPEYLFLSSAGAAGLEMHAADPPSEDTYFDVVTIEIQEGILTAHAVSAYPAGIIVNCLTYDFDDVWSQSEAGLSFMESDASLGRLREVRHNLAAALPAESSRNLDEVCRILLIDFPEVPDQMLVHLQEVFNSQVRLVTGDGISAATAEFTARLFTTTAPACIQVSGLTTGLIVRDEFIPLIDINEALPQQATLIGSATEDGQQDYAFHIVQAAAADRLLEHPVGEFTVFNPRVAHSGDPTVELRVTMDGDARVFAEFYDPATNTPLYVECQITNMPPLRVCAVCQRASDVSSDNCESCGEEFPPRSNFLEDYLAGSAQTYDEPSVPNEVVPDREVPTLVLGPHSPSSTGDSVNLGAWPPFEPEAVLVDTKSCPFCAETIKMAARKCRHCGEFLEELFDTPPQPIASLSTATIFLSHATQDDLAAKEIASGLERQGVQTWLATRDIQVGDNYATKIYSAIIESTHLLVLLSPASIASNHVKREVNLAVDKDLTILPLVVSSDTDFMSQLPTDWKYWLGVVQVAPYQGAEQAVAALIRRINVGQ